MTATRYTTRSVVSLYFLFLLLPLAPLIAQNKLAEGLARLSTLELAELADTVMMVEEAERRINAIKYGPEAFRVPLLVDSFSRILPLSVYNSLRFKYLKGYALQEMGAYGQAMQVFLEIIDEAQVAGHTPSQAEAMVSLAYCYTYMGLNDKAEECSIRSLEFARTHGLRENQALSLHLLAEQLTRDGNPKAVELYDEIIALFPADSINYHSSSAKGEKLMTLAKFGRSDSETARRLLAEVTLFGNPLTPFDDIYIQRSALSSLSNYYLLTENFNRAVYYGRRHLSYVKGIFADTSEVVRYALLQLYPIEAAAGNHAAAYEALLSYQEVERAMTIQNQDNEMARASAELDVQYHELARRAAEQNVLLEQAAKTTRTRLLIVISVLSLLIISGILWAYFRSRSAERVIAAQKGTVDRSLADKEVLLREIHHRVKNNLQIITSLLQKQARRSDSPELKELIRDGQERIQSMALIHQNLYRSDQLNGVNIRSYLEDLTANVGRSHEASPGKVAFILEVAEEHLDINVAIPLGLILNELITNAYKYAFPDGRRGNIFIEFYRYAEQSFLRVSDDGVGLPSDYEIRQSNSLGLNLVNGLVGQLEGTIDWRQSEKGTTVAIQF